MPLALVLLLLVGLSAREGWSCLQCDHSVQEALSQLRFTIIPSHFDQEEIRARAQAVLLGMEGPFFRDYAVNAFVGQVGTEHLDFLASFAKKQINDLNINSLRDKPLLEELVALRKKVIKKLKTVLRWYESKACDHKACHLLKEEVWDCLHCQKISPKCIKKKYCFVDRQPRVALRYDKGSGYSQNQALPGIIVSLCLALFVLAVIVASAVTYRQNRKILLQ